CSCLEGKPIKSQWHVRVVSVGRAMVATVRKAYCERRRNTHHIPAAMRRITVQIFTPDLRVCHFTLRYLPTCVVAPHADLLNGLANIPLFLLSSGLKCS